MSLKDKLNLKKNSSNLLNNEEIENNEFYFDSNNYKGSKGSYKKPFNKKILLIPLVLLLIILPFIFLKKDDEKPVGNIFDLGNILNKESSEKNEEQKSIHSLILRNSAWGTLMDDVAIEEKGNLIDYGNDYLTCDYETLFGITWLPTYLFQNNELVAIVYEANLSLANLAELSSIHQDVAVNIHYVYEQLYRENNKWATGQDRKYDKNLWTESILNGRLTMQSVWNSADEKVFLVTNNKPLFGFLQKQKGTDLKASMAFIICSDNFLLKNDFNALMEIKPTNSQSGSYNVNGEVIDMVTPDDVNPNTQVGATTNYVGTGISSEGLTDEEFEAIFNELNGNNTGNKVDKDGNIVDENGNIIQNNSSTSGPVGGGTTMKGPNVNVNPGSNITNTQVGDGNNSNVNIQDGSGNNSNGITQDGTGSNNGNNGNGTGSGNNGTGTENNNNNNDNSNGESDILYDQDYEYEVLPENSIAVSGTPTPPPVD